MFLITKAFALIFILSIFLFNCGSSEKNIEGNIKESRIKTIPHGVVQFYGQVENIDEEKFVCFVSIDSVVGIGAGIRPISKGNVLKFSFNEIQKATLVEYHKGKTKHRFEMIKMDLGRDGNGKNFWKLNRLNF